MQRYRDRRAAGLALAKETAAQFRLANDGVVIALPRGGVPVAAEVAKILDLPLEVLVVRKLGVPKNPEYGFGAISEFNALYLNPYVISAEGLSEESIARVIAQEQAELQRRVSLYRGGRAISELRDKVVLIVDDGIATGSTLRAAIQAVRSQKPAEVIVCVPVAPLGARAEFLKYADEFICPLYPDHLGGVGAWYENFDQVSDDEVIAALG